MLNVMDQIVAEPNVWPPYLPTSEIVVKTGESYDTAEQLNPLNFVVTADGISMLLMALDMKTFWAATTGSIMTLSIT
jgi:hypothetical protein